MEEKKELRRKCFYCGVVGTAGKDVFRTIDPYAQDVEGKEERQWLHERCADELARDI